MSIIKILLTITLLVSVSLLVPSYSYINNTSETMGYTEIVNSNITLTGLKQLNKYLIASIIISYLFVFISLSSTIYDISQRKFLFIKK